MNNVTIGGVNSRTGEPFAYYETLGGGMGATPYSHGESAIHSHMTNTLNTPIEALEYSYPFLVRRYSIRENSGGMGEFVGGNGLIREIELLDNAEITVLSERRKLSPYGLFGGSGGKSGRNVVISDGVEKDMPPKFSARLKKGDVVRIETPGGGGYRKTKNL
jgi:N-methylhydantoinase B